MSSGPSAAMDAAQSICNESSESQTKEKSAQSPGIIMPLGLVALQIGIVKKVWAEEGEVDYSPENNPFSRCTWIAPAVTTVLYLAIVFGGQKLMEKRAPFDEMCKPFMLIYNLYQTVFNAWWIVMVVIEVYNLGYPIFRLPLTLQKDQFNLGVLIWLHYQNKYLEMLDTVFMVLRKKTRQISFLHCYHHILLMWVWWIVCAYGCGGESYFGAVMNSFIHVLMYGYYFLSTIKVAVPWKRYLTKLQMLQFAICLSHTIYAMVSGIYPAWLCLWEVWVMTNMLYLFNRFYKKNYKKKQAKSSEVSESKPGKAKKLE